MSTNEKKSRRKALVDNLKTRFRFVVMNDSTFEEKFKVVLTPLAIFITVGAFSLIMIFLITYLIAFTPLREYIPGYADPGMRRKMEELAIRTDSLYRMIGNRDAYIANIRDLLAGKERANDKVSKPDSTKKYSRLDVTPGREDSLLRSEVENQDKFSLSYGAGSKVRGISSFLFFAPVKGKVTSGFKSSNDHFGVDIVAPSDEAIKSTLDGTVTFAAWTPETGHVIQVQHDNDLVSIYKHNSVLLKKAGQRVQAGEAIAIIGNSGEQTTGPHLHFELWYKGNAIDPQQYISF